MKTIYTCSAYSICYVQCNIPLALKHTVTCLVSSDCLEATLPEFNILPTFRSCSRGDILEKRDESDSSGSTTSAPPFFLSKLDLELAAVAAAASAFCAPALLPENVVLPEKRPLTAGGLTGCAFAAGTFRSFESSEMLVLRVASAAAREALGNERSFFC